MWQIQGEYLSSGGVKDTSVHIFNAPMLWWTDLDTMSLWSQGRDICIVIDWLLLLVLSSWGVEGLWWTRQKKLCTCLLWFQILVTFSPPLGFQLHSEWWELMGFHSLREGRSYLCIILAVNCDDKIIECWFQSSVDLLKSTVILDRVLR